MSEEEKKPLFEGEDEPDNSPPAPTETEEVIEKPKKTRKKRAPLSDERKAQLRAQLEKGRKTSAANRARKAKANKIIKEKENEEKVEKELKIIADKHKKIETDKNMAVELKKLREELALLKKEAKSQVQNVVVKEKPKPIQEEKPKPKPKPSSPRPASPAPAKASHSFPSSTSRELSSQDIYKLMRGV
jgi:hypothetical protein